jgi:hypothetical protein
MAQQITLYEYLATNVPSDSFTIINADGNLRKPNNNLELSQQIKSYVTTNGESGLLNLAKIHPDRELIEAICSSCSNNYLTANKEIEKKENFSNFSENVNPSDKETINSSKLLIVGGFILIGLAIIMNRK